MGKSAGGDCRPGRSKPEVSEGARICAREIERLFGRTPGIAPTEVRTRAKKESSPIMAGDLSVAMLAGGFLGGEAGGFRRRFFFRGVMRYEVGFWLLDPVGGGVADFRASATEGIASITWERPRASLAG